MPLSETDMLIRQTAAYVKMRGRSIALKRPAPLTETLAGGRTREPGTITLLPVRRAFIDVTADTRSDADPGSAMEEGHALLCLPDDDVREGDFFSIGTVRYTVRKLHRRDYELRADLEERTGA
jgi:hypothetical protein